MEMVRVKLFLFSLKIGYSSTLASHLQGAWTEIKTVLRDKDFTRKGLFIMKREISTEKLGIRKVLPVANRYRDSICFGLLQTLMA